MKEKNEKVVVAAKSINFNAVAKYTKTNAKSDSIYLSEILSGTEKERKAIRRKIRRVRDVMVENFLSAKKEEQKQIANDWKEFAKSVYKNIYVIFEANTSEDKVKDLAAFVSGVRKILEEK